MRDELHKTEGVSLAPPPLPVPTPYRPESPRPGRPGVSVLFDATRFEHVGDHYVLYGSAGEELVRVEAGLVLKCQRITTEAG